ncbi:hypothetical protein B0I37DRAFT_431538 [Chaetomium sp. MPI-CAGE-AT-0009]|nr:hypothetical protein B0I37DRAFT_431538 [Chaetomium sp. MPI-CAGE-AT-0009]
MAGRQDEQSDVVVALDIFECDACGSAPGYPSYRHPGDSLEGRVVISTKSTLQFSLIEVLFQGLQSTNVFVYGWEHHKLESSAVQPFTGSRTTVRARNLFMSIKYGAALDSIQQHDDEDGWKRYSCSFSFVIPSVFWCPHDNTPSLCCSLPPSFGTARSAPVALSPAPALSITYAVGARIRYREKDDSTVRHAEAREPVNILPYLAAEPPTDIQDFPGEFVLSGTTPLWKHALLGGRLGSVVFNASEPLPLVYSASTPLATTECTLSITVHPVSMSLARVRNLSFTVRPATRAKTFYSVAPMPCVPRQTDLTGKAIIRLHDDVVKLAEQRFSDIEWEYRPAGAVTGTPPPYERQPSEPGGTRAPSSTSRSSWSSGRLSSGGGSACGSDHSHEGVWRASLKLAISPPERLVPAFCTSLIARSYSLLLRIRAGGVYGRSCDLELPLQVLYAPPPHPNPRSAMDDRVSSPCEGPDALLAQEDTLPAYDDASTTSRYLGQGP